MATDPSRWADRAACRGLSTHLVPENGVRNRRRTPGLNNQIAAAKAVCATCPVLEQCRAWSVEADDDPVPYHVAGGLLPQERAKARRELRNARTTGVVARKHGVLKVARTCTCWVCAERLSQARRRQAMYTARRREQFATGTLDINHGTYSGYKQHQHAGVPYCDPCRLAYNTYQREYRRQARTRGLISA